eukprot:7043838-Karenia_brevis.AAC.1
MISHANAASDAEAASQELQSEIAKLSYDAQFSGSRMQLPGIDLPITVSMVEAAINSVRVATSLPIRPPPFPWGVT